MCQLNLIINADNIFRLFLILIAIIICFCLLKSYENDKKRRNEIIIPAMKELQFVKNFNPIFYPYEFLLSAFTNDYENKLFPSNPNGYFKIDGRNWFDIEINGIEFEYNSLYVFHEEKIKEINYKTDFFDGILIKIKKEYINIDKLPKYDGLLNENRDIFSVTKSSNNHIDVYKLPINTYKVIEDKEYYWLFKDFPSTDLVSETFNESLLKTKEQAKNQTTQRFNEFYNDFKKYLNIKDT